MVDKDGVWLDELDNKVHSDWNDGIITNEFRNWLVESIQELRDRL